MPPILIILFGFSMATVSLYYMLEGERAKINSQVHSEAIDLKDGIEREFYKAESLLRGMKGFFHSSQNITKSEFQTYCHSTIDQKTQLHLIEWQPKVAETQRDSYERKALRDGIKNFKLFEIDNQGKQIPAKERPFHFPVYFSYSVLTESQAVGLDLSFSPTRMRSKYRSMKLGQPVTSGSFPVIVKNNSRGNPGFAITYPIFNDSSITASNDLKHLKGFIAIVLYINEFFKPLAQIDRQQFIEFEVQDHDDQGKTIFSTLTNGHHGEGLSQSIPINVGNRLWDLVVYPTENFLKKEFNYFPWVIWCLMMAISLGLGIYLFLKAKNQEKLNLYERQLQQKQRLESLGVLASGIAHEFNNILHCISLTTENLDTTDPLSKGKSKKDQEDQYKTILDFCRRGTELVRQILSFARKDSGTYKEIFLSEEILKTMEFIRSSSGHQIEYKMEISKDSDVPFYMNINHVSQILINLCNNASYSMKNRGEIGISYHLTGDGHIISVKDQGDGIKEEYLELIFDPFFTTKPVNEGTGLGLSVIFGIVKSYNGDIEVTSKLGKGSIFTVKLPRKAVLLSPLVD